MILPDVNILVFAFRDDSEDHDAYRSWLNANVRGDAAFALSELVLSGFLRIVTNRRIYVTPAPLDQALVFCEGIMGQRQCVIARPGPRHWQIFARLCRESNARGGLVPDAYFAALEHGCEWITADRDFARFEGLRWRHPLA